MEQKKNNIFNCNYGSTYTGHEDKLILFWNLRTVKNVNVYTVLAYIFTMILIFKIEKVKLF